MNIEEQIRRAMEEGQFTDLPGKGKPLKLNENAFEDPEWHMANKVMKDAGFSLPWIERWQEIEAGLEAARVALRRAWNWRGKALAAKQPYELVEAEWRRAEKIFRDQITALNKHVFLYNLEAPTIQFQRLVFDAEREIEAVMNAASNAESSG